MQPTVNVVIREAIPFDRTQIVNVNRTTWETCYQHIYSQAEITALFKSRLHQKGSWVFQRDRRLATLVAEIDERIIGFIGIGDLLNGTEGEITTFYVLPEYQGMGIGCMLFNYALEQLRDGGYDGAWVWTLASTDACHFYEQRGCIKRDEGVYTVGQHQEEAIGYWYAF